MTQQARAVRMVQEVFHHALLLPLAPPHKDLEAPSSTRITAELWSKHPLVIVN
jgi:hypothetical protein